MNNCNIRDIYLLRHTDPQNYNPGKQRCCIGVSTDISLSQSGKEQAYKLHDFFASKDFEQVFSSPMKRCQETAQIIAGNKQIIIVEQLKEIEMGKWEGLSFEQIRSQYPEIYAARGKDILHVAPPGGEPFIDCAIRAKKAFQDILASTTKNIIIVSHAGVNRTILSEICGLPLAELLQIPQKYGCINHLSQDQDGKVIVKDLNFTPIG